MRHVAAASKRPSPHWTQAKAETGLDVAADDLPETPVPPP